MKKYNYAPILTVLSFFLIITMGRCTQSNDTANALDIAESLMEAHSDSSLSILKGINPQDLSGDREKARHSLLYTIALDKNYIDTTNFDVLQAALDYYPKHGSPDEKLRTYYYKGVIHINACDDDLAMQAWLNANELEKVTDSLTLARLLVAEGTLYYKQYRISDFVDNNIKASKIYKMIGNTNLEFKSYCRALDGAIILKDKEKADSIVQIAQQLINSFPQQKSHGLIHLLRYYIEFGSIQDIQKIIDELQQAGITDKVKFNLAHAFIKIGDAQTGLKYLDEVKIESSAIRDSLTYLSLKSKALEDAGHYSEALNYFHRYSKLLEKFHNDLFSNDLLFSEKKHEMEIKSLLKVQRRDNIIKILVGGIIILICLSLLVYNRNKLNKAARIIAEQEANNLRLTRDNLRLQLDQLDAERNQLNSLLDKYNELSEPMQEAIRTRLTMLNSLLAKEISDNDVYAQPYHKWIESIHSDRKAFMESTQMAFRVSHPRFISYLEEHSLSKDEINYVCLYALGLRGKEVGEYIQLRRHYNVSSEIRRKLGLGDHATNLGLYIRSLLTTKEL